MGSSLPCPSPTASTLLTSQGPCQNPSSLYPFLPSLSAWSQSATSVPVCLTPTSLLYSPFSSPHTPLAAQRGAESREQAARNPGPWSAEQCPRRHTPAFLEALPSRAGWREEQVVVMESYILEQEVTLGREPNNGRGGSTVVWGTTLGAWPWEQPPWS